VRALDYAFLTTSKCPGHLCGGVIDIGSRAGEAGRSKQSGRKYYCSSESNGRVRELRGYRQAPSVVRDYFNDRDLARSERAEHFEGGVRGTFCCSQADTGVSGLLIEERRAHATCCENTAGHGRRSLQAI